MGPTKQPNPPLRGRGVRWSLATFAIPIFAALTSFGFARSEAGILHARRGAEVDIGTTHGEDALRRLQIERRMRVRAYASWFGIPWKLSERIYDAAVNEGIDADLAYRLVKVESQFRQEAIGPQGSIGFTQVQPRTARWLDPGVTRERLFDGDINLRLGFRYLRMLHDRYGDVRLALLAYNRGPGTIEELLVAGEDPGNGYARRVLGVRTGSGR